MDTRARKEKQQATDEVQMGIYMPRTLRSKGQAAVKILGYGDMTKFIKAKLNEAIAQAGIAPPSA